MNYIKADALLPRLQATTAGFNINTTNTECQHAYEGIKKAIEIEGFISRLNAKSFQAICFFLPSILGL